MQLFLTGTYTTGPVPIYSADAQGRLGRVIERMSEAQVLAALEKAGAVPQSIIPAAPASATPASAVPASASPGWLARLTAFLTTLIRRT